MKILAIIYENAVDLFKYIEDKREYAIAIIDGTVEDIEKFPQTNEWIINLTSGATLYADLIQKGD